MLDSDPHPLPVMGTAITPERIDAARAHLAMMRSLLAEVNESVHHLVPPSSGTWRSTAADNYAQMLDRLREHVFAAREGLADAEQSLTGRLRRMEDELELARAAGDPTAAMTHKETSWTTR
jgi:hypothetical protein